MITNHNTNSKTDDAKVIASFFGVSPNYVRRIISDKNQKIYKGTHKDSKVEAIRKAYYTYINGKNKLIKAVEKLVPFKQNQAA